MADPNHLSQKCSLKRNYAVLKQFSSVLIWFKGGGGELIQETIEKKKNTNS